MENSKLEIISARIELVVLGFIILICWAQLLLYGFFFFSLCMFWFCYILGQLKRLVGYHSHNELIALTKPNKKNLEKVSSLLLGELKNKVTELTVAQREYFNKILKPCIFILLPKSRWAIRGTIISNIVLCFPEATLYPVGSGVGYLMLATSCITFALAAMDMP